MIGRVDDHQVIEFTKQNVAMKGINIIENETMNLNNSIQSNRNKRLYGKSNVFIG